jgi:hypothetical protein
VGSHEVPAVLADDQNIGFGRPVRIQAHGITRAPDQRTSFFIEESAQKGEKETENILVPFGCR